MSNTALLVDIGSTFTKGVLVDLGTARTLRVARVASTVSTDVRHGLTALRERLLGDGPEPAVGYASSSAAGGLHIIASGLVPALTVEAARQAALGAGGKVSRSFSYKLTAEDLAEIGRRRPDILLLCGGTDGGDEAVILANAAAIAAGVEPFGTVVVAGNRVASPQAARILRDAGWQVELTVNVLPEVRRIETAQVREVIRRLFLENIVRAKGVAAAAELVGGVIMPTPSAVLAAAEVIASGGPADGDGLFGSVVVVDVGGATTDVVSVATESPPRNVVRSGLPEPRVKRTVEGDLGVRHNAESVVELIGREAVVGAVAGLDDARLEAALATYAANPEHLSGTGPLAGLDRAMTGAVIDEASRRHAGTIEELYVPGSDEVYRLHGKDLRSVEAVVGTGGPLTSVPRAAELLGRACFDPRFPESLRPRDPELFVDRDYVLFAVGLLAADHREQARALARSTLGSPVAAEAASR